MNELEALKLLSKHPDFHNWFYTQNHKETCGCGADNATFDYVPDTFFGLSVALACCIHDHRYEIGGTEEDKLQADRELLANCLTIVEHYDSQPIDCSDLPWYKCAWRKTKKAVYPTWWSRHRAMTYYDAVMRKGDDSFNYHLGAYGHG